MVKSALVNSWFLVIGLATCLSGCGMFGYDSVDGGANSISAPPEKVSATNNSSTPQAQQPQATKANTNTTKKSANKASETVQPTTPRIQEKRSNGVVTEIKVRNRGNIPDYYIYPEQPQPTNDNMPNKVSTPTWQINW